MKRTRFYLLLCLVIFAPCLVAACAGWFRADTQQNRLAAQLFVAINHDNTPAVARLLDQGANPNAHSEIEAEPPSFLQWIREKVLFRRARISTPKYVFSAFDAALFQPGAGKPDIVLATILLAHGANLKNPYGLPIEVYTISSSKTAIVLMMPYGGTSRQSVDWLRANQAMGSGIVEHEFKGSPEQIGAFVQAAEKSGATIKKW